MSETLVHDAQAIRVLLVAPNVSGRMGGEALKALSIMTGLRELGIDVVQLTHDRVRAELETLNPDIPIHYLNDDFSQRLLHKLRLGWLLSVWGSWLLHRRAIQLVHELHCDLVHFTSPISPTLPYFQLDGCPVVIGPLNGNILHPPALMDREVWNKKLGALALVPFQKIFGTLFTGKRHATLLVSGGRRTIDALKLAGCRDEKIIETLDSGVSEAMANEPRIRHENTNYDFIFVGRLIRYKACDLAIRALAKTDLAKLHIVGDGDERAALETLAKELGVSDRVVFHGWVAAGEPLMVLFRTARAFIFPTLAEANGIVVQEAMMLGLPVVAVNWGGPQQLLDTDTGILIAPLSEEYIAEQLADAMNRLATDSEFAERLSINARKKAETLGFAWPELLKSWIDIYRQAAAPQ